MKEYQEYQEYYKEAAESLSKEIDFMVMCDAFPEYTLIELDFNIYLDHQKELDDWVAANCRVNLNRKNKWLFKYKEDAMLFALRWA